jgi:hypothetical protein
MTVFLQLSTALLLLLLLLLSLWTAAAAAAATTKWSQSTASCTNQIVISNCLQYLTQRSVRVYVRMCTVVRRLATWLQMAVKNTTRKNIKDVSKISLKKS